MPTRAPGPARPSSVTWAAGHVLARTSASRCPRAAAPPRAGARMFAHAHLTVRGLRNAARLRAVALPRTRGPAGAGVGGRDAGRQGPRGLGKERSDFGGLRRPNTACLPHQGGVDSAPSSLPTPTPRPRERAPGPQALWSVPTRRSGSGRTGAGAGWVGPQVSALKSTLFMKNRKLALKVSLKVTNRTLYKADKYH